MKRLSIILLAIFWVVSALGAQADPTMSGRIVSYDGSKGILVLERDDKSTRRFEVTDKTVCEFNGRNTSPSVLRVGSKISVQIAGALNRDPLKARKIVDWGSSSKIVATGAKSPYHTKVSQYASSNGGGGIPDGAPVGAHSPHHTMGEVAHGGSVNMPNPQTHPAPGHMMTPGQGQPHSLGQGTQHYPNSAGMYQNQGQTTMMPLDQMNTNPVFYPSGGDLMGNEGGQGDGSMIGMNDPSYGAGGTKMTGRVMQVEGGVVLLQSFEHAQLQRVIIGMASASPELLVPGQMIEVFGTLTPQGFQATQIKAAGGF